MPTQKHKKGIEAACKFDSKAQTRGFKKNVMKAIADYFGDVDDELSDLLTGVVPDAHAVDVERREIRIYESVVTHNLPEDKVNQYSALWFHLDSLGSWEVLLFMIMHGVVCPMSLTDAWYHKIGIK